MYGSAPNQLGFNTDTLLRAISATFKNRETPAPAEEFDALTEKFAEEHRVQWNAFVKKIGEDELTDAFGKIVADLRSFAMPLLRSLARGEKFTQKWNAKKGWIAP